MDGMRFGSYCTPNQNSKRRKIQITTLSKVQPFKKNYYNQQNPYALNKNPSTPLLNKPVLSRENSSNRDTISSTSSQKSTKIIRTNGLARVQKPNISSSRVSNRSNFEELRGSSVGQRISNGYSNQYPPQTNLLYQQPNGFHNNNQQYYNRYPNSHLQQENTNLRLQNIRLKEQMLKMQMSHNEEITALKQHIERLFHMAKQLEEQVKIQDKQWIKYQNQLNK